MKILRTVRLKMIRPPKMRLAERVVTGPGTPVFASNSRYLWASILQFMCKYVYVQE
jgi:hypothetical protein